MYKPLSLLLFTAMLGNANSFATPRHQSETLFAGLSPQAGVEKVMYRADETQQLVFKSQAMPAKLIELYSSHGCSSCPPAQKWVNNLKNSPDLFTRIVPMVFHVDYWDYIGWQDPFANKAFSERQHKFRQQGLVNSVYTPGFVVDGKEWTGWFRGQSIDERHTNAGDVGILTAILDKQEAVLSFSPSNPTSVLTPDTRYVNIAILGFDLQTKVTRGENARKTLTDNFVVLGFTRKAKYPLPYAVS